jgi:5-methylcytosine-specific restriction endonuclease McrA
MIEKSNIHGSYQALLFDKRWIAKRALILQRDNSRCVICGSTEHLVVHHKQYHFNNKRNEKYPPWEYDDKYLVTLCESCHSRGHAKYDIPMKYIND